MPWGYNHQKKDAEERPPGGGLMVWPPPPAAPHVEKPTKKKKRSPPDVTVLEEEEFQDSLQYIIERDFYPELHDDDADEELVDKKKAMRLNEFLNKHINEDHAAFKKLVRGEESHEQPRAFLPTMLSVENGPSQAVAASSTRLEATRFAFGDGRKVTRKRAKVAEVKQESAPVAVDKAIVAKRRTRRIELGEAAKKLVNRIYAAG
jgi:hypothetical protein